MKIFLVSGNIFLFIQKTQVISDVEVQLDATFTI